MFIFFYKEHTMGYVDRGGGREARGASLRRSKKNPGCGTSRQLSKPGGATPTVDPFHRPPAIPPPVFALPQELETTICALSEDEKSESYYLYPSLLAAGTTGEVLKVAGEWVDHQLEAPAASEPSHEAVRTDYHVDSAVALLSRRLAEESVQEVSRRAVEEGNVAAMLGWTSDVERQTALHAHCETALKTSAFSCFIKHITSSIEGAEGEAVGPKLGESVSHAGAVEANKLKKVHFDPSLEVTTSPPSCVKGVLKHRAEKPDPPTAPPRPSATVTSTIDRIALTSSLPYAIIGIHPNNIDRMNQPLLEEWLGQVAGLALKSSPGTSIATASSPILNKGSASPGSSVEQQKGVVGGPAVVALLSGLDLHRKCGTHHAQEWALRKLYKLAARLDLPLVLHLRVDPSASVVSKDNEGGGGEGACPGGWTLDPQRRLEMQQTGDRLAFLLQELIAKHKEEENDSDDSERENDEAAMPQIGNAEGKEARSRHPPAIVLHNAWTTLALSTALQGLMQQGRPQVIRSTTAAQGRPAMYLSVSAEDMVTEEGCASSESREDRLIHLSVLPSLNGSSSPADGSAVVTLSQLLITSASPWHTPATIQDEYVRSRPNEPANFPFVLQAIYAAMKEKEKLSGSSSSSTDSDRLSLLARIVNVNALAVFFGRYWVYRHQISQKEGAVVHTAVDEEIVVRPTPSRLPAAAVDAAVSHSKSGASSFFTTSPECAVQYECAACHTPLFRAGQAFWHHIPEKRHSAAAEEHGSEVTKRAMKPASTAEAVLLCNGGPLMLPLTLPVSILQQESERNGLISALSSVRDKSHKQPNYSTAEEEYNTMQTRSSKKKKNKKQAEWDARNAPDSDDDIESDTLVRRGDGAHTGKLKNQGKMEEVTIDFHSRSIQVALRQSLHAQYGKSFWIISSNAGAHASSVGIACANCRVALGVLDSVPLGVVKGQGHSRGQGGSDSDDDDGGSSSSSSETDKYLSGGSRSKKKKAHDKLARKKQIKRELHEKRAGRGFDASTGNGALHDGFDVSAMPVRCKHCRDELLWSAESRQGAASRSAAASSVLGCHLTLNPHTVAVASGELVESRAPHSESEKESSQPASFGAKKSKRNTSSLAEALDEVAIGEPLRVPTEAARRVVEKDAELERLLLEAALEREQIEKEKEMEAIKAAEEQELMKRQNKRAPKKNVKANNRSNFTHFRNKDFGKNLPSGKGTGDARSSNPDLLSSSSDSDE